MNQCLGEAIDGPQILAYPLAGNANGNFVASTIYNALKHVDFIPPHIIIQMDNASINKSRTVLSSLALLLVFLPNVQKVTLANFQVGHTHNEVRILLTRRLNYLTLG